MVGEDFPFYILLIWRMYKNQSLYVCDDLETFIPSCLDKIEKLVSDEVADVFNNFMKRLVHIIMPRCACAQRHTVVCLCVCVSVCLSVLLL